MSENNNIFNNLDKDLKFTSLNIIDTLKLGRYNSSSADSMNNYPPKNNLNNQALTFPLFPANSAVNSNNNAQPSSTNKTPLSPYPSQIPTIIPNGNNFDGNNFDGNNFDGNNTNLDNEFPSEDIGDELYSYNSPENNGSNTANLSNNNDNTITPMDILRNVDLSLYEETSRSGYSNDDIDSVFNSIQESNPNIFSALKAYRVPYPIATLLVKKIIQATLEYKIVRGD